MVKKIRDITVVFEHTGESLSIDEIDGTITASQLITTLTSRLNLPSGANGVLIRKLNHKQLLPSQTLQGADIQDHETLIADFEVTSAEEDNT